MDERLDLVGALLSAVHNKLTVLELIDHQMASAKLNGLTLLEVIDSQMTLADREWMDRNETSQLSDDHGVHRADGSQWISKAPNNGAENDQFE